MNAEEFLKEFGSLAETEGGVSQLRALVVEQAVNGRLEGARFFEQLCPLEAVVPLIQTGPFGSLLHKSDYVHGGTPLINPINIVDGDIVPDPAKAVSNATLERLELYRVRPGDVVLGRRGEMGRTAVVGDHENGWLCGTGSMFLRPPSQLLAQYLSLWLGSPGVRLRLTGGAVGTTMSNLNQRILRGLQIAVPPLPEQKRIAEKVDQLMTLCDELEAKQKQKREKVVSVNKAALSAVVHAPDKSKLKSSWSRVQDHFEVLYELPENVKELRQTILQLAVMGKLVRQDPKDEDVDTLLTRVERERREAIAGRRRGGRGSGTSCEAVFERSIPKSWRKCSLGDLADHIVDGTHHTPKYVDKGMDFISAKDIRRGEISFEGCRQISKDEYDALTLRCAPKRGNVLITKSGSIGEVAIVEVDRPFTLFESVALVPVLPSMNARYVALVMQLEGGGKFAQEKRRGVGVPHLHLVDLRTMPVPVPPLAEQERIVTKVRRLMDLCGDLEAKLGQHRGQGQRLMRAVVEGLVG